MPHTRKEKILGAATYLFSSKGYKNTSVSDVSELTGVANSTIFYHFKNKEDLFLHILKAVKDDILKEYDDHLRGKSFRDGLDMAEQAIHFYFELVGCMEEKFLLLHRHYPYQLAEENSECRGYLEDIYNCLVDIFEQAILKGQKDGSIADLPARKNAYLILSMIEGLVGFKVNNLYNIGSLYTELIEACRRMLQPKTKTPKRETDD
ncbi:MAG: TetR/AcrR family transcriptional regulator [Planctomycetota bacterium]